ncbi:MAG: glutamate--tRNA ligase, partial [Pacificimonas sp.]
GAMDDLVASFDFDYFGRAAAKFDPKDLAALNAKIVHQMPFADVKDRLPTAMNADAWAIVRQNAQRVSDAAELWQMVVGPVTPRAEPDDIAFLREARTELATLEWDETIWKRWTGVMKEKTGRKGRGLFLPLRRAVTGADHGPDMGGLLHLIGQERVLARLDEVVA